MERFKQVVPAAGNPWVVEVAMADRAVVYLRAWQRTAIDEDGRWLFGEEFEPGPPSCEPDFRMDVKFDGCANLDAPTQPHLYRFGREALDAIRMEDT